MKGYWNKTAGKVTMACMAFCALIVSWQQGVSLPASNPGIESASFLSVNSGGFLDRLLNQPGNFLLQLVIIILAARLLGFVFQKAGQPLVIGEIIAGIMLGPSMLGALMPEAFDLLFPEQSVDALQKLSQLGLILFMFLIGMELNMASFRKTLNKAGVISIASIAIPFALGLLLACILYPTYAPENVRLLSFALFLGITMSITAFPVLARIVQERKLTATPVGTMAITVAALGDAVAWCILAVVIAIAKAGSVGTSLYTIGFTVLYILVMYFFVRPLMQNLGRIYTSRETMGKPVVALIFLVILVSSLITDTIGIHALFGAFMAGIVMPENADFRRVFTEKIEDLSLVVLLPLFFVTTGLRTEISLISSGHMWLVCIIIIFTAIAGKFGGTLLAARYTGISWNHSLVLGVLMNSKGLMELIVLNIGYDMGILDPGIFAMLVLMTLATTFITGPGLNLINRFYPSPMPKPGIEKVLRIMLSFANPRTGGHLLNLARQLTGKYSGDIQFIALHISPRSDLSPGQARIFERESFMPVRKIARENNLSIHTIYQNTSEVASCILKTCRAEKPNILMVGTARALFTSDILGGVLKRIIQESPCDVLVFNENNFSTVQTVLLLYFGNGDECLFDYARLLQLNESGKFYVLQDAPAAAGAPAALSTEGIHAEYITRDILHPAFLQSLDLIMVAERNWKYVESQMKLEAGQLCSLLIIHTGKKGNALSGSFEEYP